MKLAFIVNQFPCISETFILNQITGLIERGHEVDIFAYSCDNTFVLHEDIQIYDLLSRTYYFPEIPINKIYRFLRLFKILFSELYKKPMLTLKSLNYFKYKKNATSLNLVYKITPFVNKDQYDIVHCHFGPNGIIGAYLKDIGAIRSKLITSFHGFDLSSYIKNFGAAKYNFLFKKGDLFLPVSIHYENILKSLGCPPNKIIVHRMGVDTKKIKCYFNKKNDKVKILTVARFVEKKGLPYAIQAVAAISKKHKNIEYTIVGNGPMKFEIENLIKELNMSNYINLTGWKTQKEINQLMEESNIFLAPSVTATNKDQEGIPVTIMEAMAHELPVLSTYHSGIPELVMDGISGFLVPERNIKALTEKLDHLIQHPEIWPEMGKAGRKYVEDNYDIDKLNDRLVNIYQRLLNQE